MIGVGFQLDKAKGMFFHRKPVLDATDRATRRVLSRFGAFVRRRARSSIRRRKKPSAPGKPPSAHTGLIKQILFGYEPEHRNVVIGPIRLNKIGNAPEALEHGGPSEVYVGRRGRRRTRSVQIAPHPFMRPAFEAERPKLDGMWANSVKP